MSRVKCVACQHAIDEAARVCPYCGADPSSGERIDTQALLQEVFNPRELTASETVMEYARQRQGIIITISVIGAILLLGLLHQFVSRRNATAVSDAPAVPLTEISDLANQPVEGTPQALPDLDFQYDGQPRTMRTLIAEPGAVAPAQALAQGAQTAATTTGLQPNAPLSGAAIRRPPAPINPALPPPQPPPR